MAMMLSVGGAATVLTVLARRNAPGEGWREALQAGVHRHRGKEDDDEAAVDAAGPVAEDVLGEEVPQDLVEVEDVGVEELFEIAEAPPEPAYTQASLVQHYLDRMSPTVVRWTSPAVAKVTPAVHRVTPVVSRWSELAQKRIEPALDKLRR